MGTKRIGTNCKVQIGNGATPEVFTTISGNTNLSVTRQGNTVDTSTKDDYPYGTSAAGTRSVSISATFRPELPDASGYDALVTAAAATTPFNIQIVDGATVVFSCSVYVTTRDNTLNINAAGEASCTFVNAAPPTVDDL